MKQAIEVQIKKRSALPVLIKLQKVKINQIPLNTAPEAGFIPCFEQKTQGLSRTPFSTKKALSLCPF